MYKDADKQRAAWRRASARFRARRKGEVMGEYLVNGFSKTKPPLHANLAEGGQGGHWLEHGGLEVDLDDDHGGLSDLSETAQKAADEQAKLLKRVMQRSYVSRKDLAQFLSESAAFKTLSDAVQDEIKKHATNEARQKDRLAFEPRRGYFDKGIVQDFADAFEPLESKPGTREARLFYDRRAHCYTWSASRVPGDNTYPVEGDEPVISLALGNPLLRFARVINVSTSAVAIPTFADITVTVDGNVADAPGTPEGITSTGELRKLKVYTAESAMTRNARDDIVGAEVAVYELHMSRIGAQMGKDSLGELERGATFRGQYPRQAGGNGEGSTGGLPWAWLRLASQRGGRCAAAAAVFVQRLCLPHRGRPAPPAVLSVDRQQPYRRRLRR